jgi:hypothetical protein
VPVPPVYYLRRSSSFLAMSSIRMLLDTEMNNEIPLIYAKVILK